MRKQIGFAVIAALLFSSCILNWDHMFTSLYPVSQRSTRLKEITVTEQYYPVRAVGKYNVLILSDTHFPYNDLFWKKLLVWLDALPAAEKPAFCVINGDIVYEKGEDQYELFNKEFVDKLRKTAMEGGRDIPVFCVPGNHDVGVPGEGGKAFLRKLYPYASYYRIKTAKTSFYFLDTADGTLGKPQLEDLLKHLSGDGNMKFTFTHFPFYETQIPSDRMLNAVERARLIDAYAKHNVKVAFCGHVHESRTIPFGPFTQCVVKGFNSTEPGGMLLSIDETAGTFTFDHILF